MDSLQWVHNWYYFIEAIVLLAVARLMFARSGDNKLLPAFSQVPVYLFLILIPVYFALEPVAEYSDKWVYQRLFLAVSEGIVETTDFADSGFYYYVSLVTSIFKNPFIFFLITAFVYVMGYVAFVKKTIAPSYRFILFLGVIAALGFYSYGTNTIRAGIALSVFLLAISRNSFWKQTIPLIILSVLIHKSILLPGTAYFLTRFYNPKNNFIYIWFICLVLSYALGTRLSDALQEYFSVADNRFIVYTEREFVYKTGFRVDFVIYSFLPLLLAWYYKKKGYSSAYYNHLLSTYILCNAFWLLLIRIPFTDRVAYLSWFLIPFITLYPLLTQRILERQKLLIALVIFVLFGINFYLSILR